MASEPVSPRHASSTERDADVRRFLRYLASEKRSSGNTCEHYGRDLDRLDEWCREQGIESWSQLSQHHIRRYAALQASGAVPPGPSHAIFPPFAASSPS